MSFLEDVNAEALAGVSESEDSRSCEKRFQVEGEEVWLPRGEGTAGGNERSPLGWR